MIGSELLRFQDRQEYVLADGETEGLNLRCSRPWQISYAICTNNNIEAMVTRYPLFKDINVSEEAARVTRFDKKRYLEMAEEPEVVLKDFEDVALDPSMILVGHNFLGYDIHWWRILRRLCGRPDNWDFLPNIIDTLCLSRAYRRSIQPDLSNFRAWQYKMLDLHEKIKKPKDEGQPLSKEQQHLMAQKGTGCLLGAMAREFGIEYDERYAHDAAVDTKINFQVFRKLIYSLEI